MRTFVYVDGFNLYYGALKDTQYKWLDLKKLCLRLLPPDCAVDRIKFFTAPVKPREGDSQQPERQKIYWLALRRHIPELEIYNGSFMSEKRWMPRADNPQEKVRVIKTEEKGSDVNLAVHLLNDGWRDEYDCAVIISNDSDFTEAIELTKKAHSQKTIMLLAPVRRRWHVSRQLREASNNRMKPIRTGVLKVCQLPNPVPGNPPLRKPDIW